MSTNIPFFQIQDGQITRNKDTIRFHLRLNNCDLMLHTNWPALYKTIGITIPKIADTKQTIGNAIQTVTNATQAIRTRTATLLVHTSSKIIII